MRTIKFRAWDKKNKRMFQVNDINGMMQNTYYMNKLGNIECYEDEAELMQFTGLLDRHGKEIYEGDICKYGEQIVYEVRWDGVRFYPIWYDSEYGTEAKYLEVIGNIYENHELI